MAKTINIKYGNENYTLEFTRASVRQMESAGFNINKALDTPLTSIETLFVGAFLANHGRAVKNRIPEKIIEKNGLPSGMFEKLVEMYNEPISAMFEPEDNEGNLEWESNF